MKATGDVNENTTKIKAVNPLIPNGTYPGRWSGYSVEFTVFCITYVVSGLSTGVRGLNVACSVKVENGKIEVST